MKREGRDRRISRRTFLKAGVVTAGVIAGYDLVNTEIPGQGAVHARALSEGLKEREMPHIIIKLYPGRTEEQKKQLAEAITKDVVAIAKCDESSVSVAIEEVSSQDWAEKVYKPDILDNAGKLYKKPGYNPFQ